MSAHPASAALRRLADSLDALAGEGCTPEVKADIKMTKENMSLVCRRLDLVTDPITERQRNDKYSIVRARRTDDALTIEAWNWLSQLCVKKVVMKPVEVWTCGDEELAS